MKKILAVILSLCTLFSSGLCAAALAEEPVQLSMVWMGGDTASEHFVPLLQAWNAAHPEIQITGELIDTDSEEKMRMMLASGTAPDIMMLGYGWLPAIVQAGDYLLDFNQQSILDMSGYDQHALKNLGEYNGVQAGLPACYATITMCMNMTSAEKYGVEMADNLTIDELYAKGAALHEAHPEAYLYIVHEVEVYELFRALFRQMNQGAPFNEDYTMNFTQENLTEMFSIIKKGFDTNTFMPLAEAVASSPDGACLLNGKWVTGDGLAVSNASGGIIYAISFVQGHENMDFQMFTLPKLTADSTYGNGVLSCEKMWTISKNCAHPEAALTFLDYLVNSTEATDFFQGAALSGVYATQTQFAHAASNNYSNPYITQAYEKVIDCAQPVDNAISLNSDLNTILSDALLTVCYGAAIPEDAAANAVTQLTARLAQMKQEAGE